MGYKPMYLKRGRKQTATHTHIIHKIWYKPIHLEMGREHYFFLDVNWFLNLI